MLRLARKLLGRSSSTPSAEGVHSTSELSQAYNLLWLSPRFARERGSQYYDPIPEKTVANMLITAQRNPQADVRLWVDSQRLTEQQMEFLREMCGRSGGNLGIQDLRSIPEYSQTSLFNRSDTSGNWRADKQSLIWRQVDAAKLLVCLQGDYDQVFFSDADITNLTIASPEVQGRMTKHGIIMGGGVREDNGSAWFENQMFGFDQRWTSFFRNLYEATIREVSMRGENGWHAFIDLTNTDLRSRVDAREIVYRCEHDGTIAMHPGEQMYSYGSGERRRL